MKSMSPQLLATLVQPCSLLTDGSALHKNERTGQNRVSLRSQLHGKVDHAESNIGWKVSPRVGGRWLALGAWAGGEGN